MFWFPPYLVLRHSYALARTGEHFAANDPWNGNRQTRFTIEVYPQDGAQSLGAERGTGPEMAGAGLLSDSLRDGRSGALAAGIAGRVVAHETRADGSASAFASRTGTTPAQKQLLSVPALPANGMVRRDFGSCLPWAAHPGLDHRCEFPEDGMRTVAAVAVVCALPGGGIPAFFITRGIMSAPGAGRKWDGF